jgi:vacuolar protein sorting-associated protein 13A/C
LRVYLTFRVKSLETALGTTGVLQDFINFFSGFANISDASIYFTQIDISNSYRTQ